MQADLHVKKKKKRSALGIFEITLTEGHEETAEKQIVSYAKTKGPKQNILTPSKARRKKVKGNMM